MEGRYIFCQECRAEYSDTKGDYFWAADDHLFECCSEPCQLVVRGGRWEGDSIIADTVTVGYLRNEVSRDAAPTH